MQHRVAIGRVQCSTEHNEAIQNARSSSSTSKAAARRSKMGAEGELLRRALWLSCVRSKIVRKQRGNQSPRSSDHSRASRDFHVSVASPPEIPYPVNSGACLSRCRLRSKLFEAPSLRSPDWRMSGKQGSRVRVLGCGAKSL